MKLEQVTILPSEEELILRARNSAGGAQNVIVPTDKLNAQGAKALSDLVAALNPHLPADPSETDINQITQLEDQLSALRQKVGFVARI
jgi:hypothetical protein